MSTVNGWGTMFYGWRHAQGMASTATRWFTAFYLPVVPLSRYSLTATTDFDRERLTASPSEVVLAMVGYASRTETFAMDAKLPLNPSEILVTYLKAYVTLPLLMAWPWLLAALGRQMFGVHPEWEDTAWFMPAIIVFVGVALINAIVVPMWAIQRARGYRGGIFRKR